MKFRLEADGHYSTGVDPSVLQIVSCTETGSEREVEEQIRYLELFGHRIFDVPQMRHVDIRGTFGPAQNQLNMPGLHLIF